MISATYGCGGDVKFSGADPQKKQRIADASRSVPVEDANFPKPEAQVLKVPVIQTPEAEPIVVVTLPPAPTTNVQTIENIVTSVIAPSPTPVLEVMNKVASAPTETYVQLDLMSAPLSEEFSEKAFTLLLETIDGIESGAVLPFVTVLNYLREEVQP